MMFIMHLAFSVGLIALMGGLSMFIWGLRSEGSGKELAKFVGLIIVILVLVDFVCISYYALSYWPQGTETATSRHYRETFSNFIASSVFLFFRFHINSIF